MHLLNQKFSRFSYQRRHRRNSPIMGKIKKRIKREKAGLGIRAGLTGNKVCAECKYNRVKILSVDKEIKRE